MELAAGKRIPLAGGLAVILIAGSAVAWRAREASTFFEAHILLSRFPAEESIVLSADFTALRSAGLLKDSGAALEPEYKQFLEGTGFEYKRDLDSVVASFSGSGNYFIARGRFDWDKLRAFVSKQGGSCYQDLCRVEGSAPSRHISFLPLRKDTMALAVSTNDLAATKLQTAGQRVTTTLPAAPVWMIVPGNQLRAQTQAPSGVRLMLSALRSTDRLVLTVVPVASGMEVQLEAACKTTDDARILVSQLKTTTSMIREAVTKDKDAQSDDLAQFLAKGEFNQSDKLVTGKWPMKKELLDALTQGL